MQAVFWVDVALAFLPLLCQVYNMAENGYFVSEAESGQKLLQFLTRKLHLPVAMLHRWIRTGQIRRNSRRCKPFERVVCGDHIRFPAFALQMSRQASSEQASLPPLPPVVAEYADLWALDKPASLPVHAGTGHTDSLAGRLAQYYSNASFLPTPAHRLDRHTSGLILVATTYQALQSVHQAIRERSLRKEYLAWVVGCWPTQTTTLLHNKLAKRNLHGQEKMCIVDSEQTDAQEAICEVSPLQREVDKSLLQIHLVTGRTHQIRVQLAAIGYPIVGDVKYGQASSTRRLLLHSWRITLPDGYIFTSCPDWKVPYSVRELLCE